MDRTRHSTSKNAQCSCEADFDTRKAAKTAAKEEPKMNHLAESSSSKTFANPGSLCFRCPKQRSSQGPAAVEPALPTLDLVVKRKRFLSKPVTFSQFSKFQKRFPKFQQVQESAKWGPNTSTLWPQISPLQIDYSTGDKAILRSIPKKKKFEMFDFPISKESFKAKTSFFEDPSKPNSLVSSARDHIFAGFHVLLQLIGQNHKWNSKPQPHEQWLFHRVYLKAKELVTSPATCQTSPPSSLGDASTWLTESQLVPRIGW